MKTFNTTVLRSVGLALPLLLGACASEPTQTERNFGESVRQMVRSQTYDPSTLTTPSEAPVDRTDGQLLEGAIEAYRGDVAPRDAVGSEVQISVGGGQR
jgi:hypothetical protein